MGSDFLASPIQTIKAETCMTCLTHTVPPSMARRFAFKATLWYPPKPRGDAEVLGYLPSGGPPSRRTLPRDGQVQGRPQAIRRADPKETLNTASICLRTCFYFSLLVEVGIYTCKYLYCFLRTSANGRWPSLEISEGTYGSSL